jgi:hypothetical protein
MSEKFTVIRDSREKVSHGWSFDEDSHCQGTIIEKLDTGDYSVQGLEDIVAIERKETIQEFARNCVEKRWGACMKRLGGIDHPYILFEFTEDAVDRYPQSAKVPASVRRKMCWPNGKPRIAIKYIWKVIHTAREMGIEVIFCGDARKAEKEAYRIMKETYEAYL